MTSILAKHDILKLIREKPSLVEEYMDLEAQVQPNGFDLTVREVALLETPGKIAVSNDQRVVSSLNQLNFDRSGFIDLMPGNYMLTFNEIVHIPRYLMALATA
ncbi:MAG: deoxyuridine 5'-triphosphate nucleotidohydrolase, partial [Chloroflexi bacterium]|nr:deoxyuridine 5'-triphosphate nucleotidohydrolase [Chloroflexota bacterium]